MCVDDSCLNEEHFEVVRGKWFLAEFIHARTDSFLIVLLIRVGREAANVGDFQGDVRVLLLELFEHFVNLAGHL